MDPLKKNKLNYFDYDNIFCITFGPSEIVYGIYDSRREEWELFGFKIAACLFEYDVIESYDDYELISIGEDALEEAKRREKNGVFYVDKLSDKVEYLFAIEPNIKKPLKKAKDRLYQKAAVVYFKNLIENIVRSHIAKSKMRYLVTYPSHWTLEQAVYLKSLLQMACFVDEDDHPDRLIMYNEGEAIIRHMQSLRNFPYIREGQKYMICDLSRSKLEMNLYHIKGPIDPQSVIRSTSRCNWYNGSIDEPAQIDTSEEYLYSQIILYLSSLLSTPLINITTKDLEDISNNDGDIITISWINETIEILIEHDVKGEGFTPYRIPQSVQDLYYEKLNNVKESMTEPLPQWIEDGYLKIYLHEIKEKVLKPVFDRIIQYIKKILETVTDFIDGVILVNNKYHTHIMKLIIDECKTINWKMYQTSFNKIPEGAILKYFDNVTAFDIYKPRIVHDELALSAEPRVNNTQDIIVLIDYGLEKTRVSYINTQSSQLARDLNMKHIMNLPAQTILCHDFPALNTKLIPKYPRNIGKDSNINSFSNFLLRNSKAIFILQDKGGYNQEIPALADTKFYTFEKDENGIIVVTHQRKIVEELLIATTAANLASSDHKVTRKRISFLEFSLLYFEYLADLLHAYIYSKTGVEKDKYRYCITHDNQGYPEKFTLSKKDIRRIALESNLILSAIPDNLLVLERAEAAAIYCRKLIYTTIPNKEAHLYFLQVQLHPDRCLFILNTVPHLDPDDSNSYREDGKLWECVHKYTKNANTPIKFMDIISENLWIYMQTARSILLRNCEQHQAQKRFFNSKNMQMIKNVFHDYISTSKYLNFEDSEKEHTIRMCDNESGSCCYLITTNMDLVEFVFSPAIDQLVSIIQSNIFNLNLFQGIQISNLFVMGKFLNCKDYISYKYLEDLLLAKLRKIHFPPFNNMILQSMSKKTQVRKVSGREYQQGQDDDVEDRHDSLAQISSSGSIIFSIDPRNILVERLAARTYVFQLDPVPLKVLDHIPSKRIVHSHRDGTLVNRDSYHIVILKGTPLKSLSLIDDTIIKHFTIAEYKKNRFSLPIQLLVVEADNDSYLTDTNMDENSWRDKLHSSDFGFLTCFFIPQGIFDNTSYPFSFNSCLSQTKAYKFWVEYGKNSKEIESFQEPILLKSCHSE